MIHNFLLNSKFHSFLYRLDEQLLSDTMAKGCPYCGGRLDQAPYPRSPIGIRAEHRHYYEHRFSSCCRDCRKRTSSTSVRFFGRFWFPAPVLVLISLLTLGINQYRLTQIKRHFGIVLSRKTWQRWRQWWAQEFPTTPFWQQAKGKIRADLSEEFPRILSTLFTGRLLRKLILLLKFLAPITAGILRAV